MYRTHHPGRPLTNAFLTPSSSILMANFQVPTRDTVSPANQAIFDQLAKGLGFVPNLYATLALHETALGDYLQLQNRSTTLSGKEKEVVNLVVSQVNECAYCLAAHTAIAKLNGFTDEQVVALRAGRPIGDARLDALGRFVRATAANRGKPGADATDDFLAAGYTQANLVDVVVLIGDKTVTNYLHGVTQVPVDFPAAAPLRQAVAT